MNEPQASSNPFVLSGELEGNIRFQMQRPETKMMLSVGVGRDAPMFTIYGNNEEPLVTFWRDGTCKIESELYLDEAAKTFVKAIQSIVQNQYAHPGWVVRKEHVSEFLQVDEVGFNWVQTLAEATHFARERDAMAACRTGYAVVPADEAMKF